MTVEALSLNSNFSVIALPEPQREINGAYIGDLLSWVMGRAKANDAWITIMSNINVVAVASLADVSCVILAEGVLLDDEIIKAAEEKGINVLKTELPIYETAKILSELI
jgi:AICAR transformylase/IMP cyclohydrolase PurH